MGFKLFDEPESILGSSKTKDNPHDTRGAGRTDDEPNDIPGEQNGEELDRTAENRSRNPDGTFQDEVTVFGDYE